MPDLLRMAAGDDSLPPLFRKIVEVFGVFSFPSDDHIGEYLQYGSEYHGVKWPYGLESRRVPPAADATPSPVDEYAQGLRPADDPEILRQTGELTVPAMVAMELNRSTHLASVNVVNRDGYIDNLPRGGVVEVPAEADGRGIHPRHVGPIPESFAVCCRPQYAIHELITEAYRTGSKHLLLQALLMDPVVDSISRAEKMLDEMLELQKDYLPAFT